MENKKNDNKSLFIYTGLIFVVAVLLIILSFFGQKNLEKSQPTSTENTQQTQEASGITEKAAVLSEENKDLIEENNSLKKELELYEVLLAANGYLSAGNVDKASELIESVDYESLTTDQRIIYDNIKNSEN